MHWSSIITALTLALASAFLVFFERWEPWQAFLVVVGTAVGILMTLVALILLLSKGENRQAFWRGFTTTLRNDLDEFLRFVGIRTD